MKYEEIIVFLLCCNCGIDCLHSISFSRQPLVGNEENIDNPENALVMNNDVVETATEEEKPPAYTISDFPCVLQMPELPTGCEITALTMLLNYYDYDVDKVTMATEYLPTLPDDMYYDEYGVYHGGDLNNHFIGDPESVYGYVCGTGAIVTAADSYLSDTGSQAEAVDITGSSFDDLYELVADDTPIVVWITIDMLQRTGIEGWYTDDGSYVEWSQGDHAGVLIGYSEDTVTIADPINGITEYNRADFESVYMSRGCHSVISVIIE